MFCAVIIVGAEEDSFRVVEHLSHVGSDVDLSNEHLRELFRLWHPLSELLKDSLGGIWPAGLQLSIDLMRLHDILFTFCMEYLRR